VCLFKISGHSRTFPAREVQTVLVLGSTLSTFAIFEHRVIYQAVGRNLDPALGQDAFCPRYPLSQPIIQGRLVMEGKPDPARVTLICQPLDDSPVNVLWHFGSFLSEIDIIKWTISAMPVTDSRGLDVDYLR
jgi:hypothetical protein